MASPKKGAGRQRNFQSPNQRKQQQQGICFRSTINISCLVFVGLVYYANFKWYSKETGAGGPPLHDSASAIQSLAAETSRQIRSQLASSSSFSAPAPYRTSEEMEHDVQCLHQGVSYLHFHHMRKAGGSSIRTLLVNMSKIEATEHRLHISQSEGLTFNTTCFEERPQVFLTSIRDPIDRIVSSYKYEGHTERLDRRMFANFEIPKELETAASGKETSSPLLFREWVDKAMGRYESEPKDFKADHIWVDVDNYYIKTLSNRYRDVTKPIDENDLEMAKKILAGFDLLIITEWMAETEQTLYLNRMLDTKIHMDFPYRQITARWKHAALVDDDTLAYLRQINKYDIQLYEYAKELARSRIDVVLGKKEGKIDSQDNNKDKKSTLRDAGEGGGEEGQCQAPKVAQPEYTYEGDKYVVTKNIHPDPLCMYPRDIHKPPKIKKTK